MSSVEVDAWLASLPEASRKSAKSDIKTALDAISDGDVLERARLDPGQLLDDLDDYLRRFRMFAGPTRNKVKSVFRRFLRFHGIETLPPTCNMGAIVIGKGAR